MSLAQDLQLQSVFFTWKNYSHQRAMRSKMLNRASLAFAAAESQRLGLLFSTWNTLVIHKKEVQVLAQQKRRKAMTETYAAKLIMQTDSSTLRAIFVGWWRCSKESAFHTRLETAQAERERRSRGTLSGVVPNDKPCCVTM